MKIFRYFFIALIISCLSIIYNYLPNPIALAIFSITGDGNLLVFCYGFIQIAIYNLILLYWKFFRNKSLWTLIMSVQLTILALLVPVSITDPSFGSFLTAIEDYIYYGTISYFFVVFLIEVIGVMIYVVFTKIINYRCKISIQTAKFLFIYNCLIIAGGIIFYRNDDNVQEETPNTYTYMRTPDGKFYIREYRTTDSIHIVISDNVLFKDKFEFGARKAESFYDHIFIQIYPNDVLEIDYPDSLLSIDSESKFNAFLNMTPDVDFFLQKEELEYSCYYFWFYFSKQTRTARYLEKKRNNNIIRAKEMRLKKY